MLDELFDIRIRFSSLNSTFNKLYDFEKLEMSE